MTNDNEPKLDSDNDFPPECDNYFSWEEQDRWYKALLVSTQNMDKEARETPVFAAGLLLAEAMHEYMVLPHISQ